MMSTAASSEVITILQHMLQTNTVNPPGNELPLAAWIASELQNDTIETRVVDMGANRGNVIGRIAGSGQR